MRMISLRGIGILVAYLALTNVYAQTNFSSTGNFTSTGSLSLSSFTLNTSDTMWLSSGRLDTISTCDTIRISGVINGIGQGYSGGAPLSNGQGPGGGSFSSSDGSGGGGYGGNGGAGGTDITGSESEGGKKYGSAMGTTIQMGSGGGSSDRLAGAGGNGGGAIVLISPIIIIDGQVIVDGSDGGGDIRSGGGGSGGGVLLIGDTISISGMISAQGGNGGFGQGSVGFPNNDSGGGGGGGRVKILYTSTLNHTGSINVLGGIGGPHGSAAPAEDGTIGSALVNMGMSDMICGCRSLPKVTTPVSLKVTESTCNSYNDILSGGVIEIVDNSENCPYGTTLHFSVDNGPFTTAFPVYNQDTKMIIRTTCICDIDHTLASDTTEVVTTPGSCPSALVPNASYDLTFNDPCNCSNPLNCTSGGIAYFHDTLTISTGGISGLEIRINSSTDFYVNVDCFGTLTAPLHGTSGTRISEVGATGIYKIEFWRPSGTTPVVSVIESGSAVTVPPATFSPICHFAECAEPVPTLGHWSMIILGFLLLIIQVVTIPGHITLKNSISSRPN